MAMLVAAYAAGGTPSLVTVLPSNDELWSLNGVAFVVPVVPPDCPAALEYALRLRYDTLISGTCPQCGAVPSVRTLPVTLPPDAPLVFSAIFRHKMSCPGRDDRVLDLWRAHRLEVEQLSDDEHFEAVQRGTRKRLAWLKERENTAMMTSEKSRHLADDLLEKLLNPAQTCPHLQVDPTQQWNSLIAEGHWRCESCLAYFAASDAAKRGYLGFPEEFCCDICRRFAPNTLMPLVIRIDIFVMTGAMCARCRPQYT